VVSMASLNNEAAATSTPKRQGVIASQSVQDDAQLMFQERDSSMTDDWATASERDFAAQRTVIGKFNYDFSYSVSHYFYCQLEVFNPLGTPAPAFATQGQIKELEGKMLAALEMMEEKYDSTRVLDIYSFANQSERADHASNLSKLNLVLLTGYHL